MVIKWENDDFGEINVHRSGWKTTMENLKKYINSNYNTQSDLIIDTYIDATFYWRESELLNTKKIPYKENWVGFIHHTTTGFSNSMGLFYNNNFIDSLKFCKGIIVLSYNLKKELSEKFEKYNVKIYVLEHPTEEPNIKFTIENYMRNEEKQVLHIGNWMRDISQYFKLTVPYFLKKTVLKSIRNDYSNEEIYQPNITFLNNLNSATYDEYLSKNVVYIHLTDASAINTIIECVIRSTPIFINPLPAVKEILGEDYPLYAENYEECSSKISQLHLIAKGHYYLQKKEIISFDKFNINFISILEELDDFNVTKVNICVICLDQLSKDMHPDGIIVLTCAHKIGKKCYLEWCNTSNPYKNCPICREGSLPPTTKKKETETVEELLQPSSNSSYYHRGHSYNITLTPRRNGGIFGWFA